MDITKAYIVDIETYPNCFLVGVVRADGKYRNVLEVSFRKNEIDRVIKCLEHIRDVDGYLVGFNSVGFDYPVLHEVYMKQHSLPKSGKAIAKKVFALAQKQIDSFKGEGFGNTIRTEDCLMKQMDLFRIHHFNNRAKATSLKLLEFNMRLDDIQDLPYTVGQELTSEEIDELIKYNYHDIDATLRFFNESLSQIDFRIDLSEKYGKDWINCDDTKIGAEYFAMKLEEAGVQLFKFQDGKKVKNQTPRKVINIADCLFDYYDFTRPEFIAVYNWFKQQSITETKGVFSDIPEHLLGDVGQYAEMVVKRKKFKSKPTDEEVQKFKNEYPLGWIQEEELKATETIVIDGVKTKVPKKSYWMCWKVAETLNVIVDGFRLDFGTGGIHGSLEWKTVTANKKWNVVDLDVASFYPNLAISNRIYPEHLGEKFCDIYQDMYEQRKVFKKGSAENGMMKLALNGTYGKSNDKHSIFYDPMFTMSITIGGQLTLCLLMDMWYREKINFIPIMANTDGVTICVTKEDDARMMEISKQWEEKCKLVLERADYTKMYIRDINSYIALKEKGIKRKGAYEYEDLDWHKNHSALVIQKAVEHKLLGLGEVTDFIRNHKDPFDFMLRTKVPRNSKLVLVMDDGAEVLQQNVCRYYPCKEGGKLVKLMPALEGKEEDGDRRLGIDTSWKVKTCNKMLDFNNDIDYDYYIEEANKLIEPFFTKGD